MARWIDIEAHRIYEVPEPEFFLCYEVLGQDGEPTRQGDRIYRAVRKADSKVFTVARFIPIAAHERGCYYLEEV